MVNSEILYLKTFSSYFKPTDLGSNLIYKVECLSKNKSSLKLKFKLTLIDGLEGDSIFIEDDGRFTNYGDIYNNLLDALIAGYINSINDYNRLLFNMNHYKNKYLELEYHIKTFINLAGVLSEKAEIIKEHCLTSLNPYDKEK